MRHASEVARASVAPNGTKVLQAPTATCARSYELIVSATGPQHPFALSGQHARVPLRARARAPAPGHARRCHRGVARQGRARWLRLGVAAGRVADGRSRAADLARRNPSGRPSTARCCPTSPPRTCVAHRSPIREYVVHRDFGGPDALARFRARLAGARRAAHARLRAQSHRARSSVGARASGVLHRRRSPDDLAREPHNYRAGRDGRRCPRARPTGAIRTSRAGPTPCRSTTATRASGRRCSGRCKSIAEQCDGVRCDMAMLVLPDVIARTWGERARPADGSAARRRRLLAARRGARAPASARLRVHGGGVLGSRMDAAAAGVRLHVRQAALRPVCRSQDAGAVRGHLRADPEYQRRSARFLENHDEPRAAAACSAGRSTTPRR